MHTRGTNACISQRPYLAASTVAFAQYTLGRQGTHHTGSGRWARVLHPMHNINGPSAQWHGVRMHASTQR